MSAAERDRPGPGAGNRQRELVRLVTRLIVAQAAAAMAIGLPFSRRQWTSVAVTLVIVAALGGLAAAARSGTQGAWLLAVGFEGAFAAYGLVQFISARYFGGTLFAILAEGALLHPAVARAFAARPVARRGATGEPGLGEPGLGEPGLGDAAGGALHGSAGR